jgi:hypothetical protein
VSNLSLVQLLAPYKAGYPKGNSPLEWPRKPQAWRVLGKASVQATVLRNKRRLQRNSPVSNKPPVLLDKPNKRQVKQDRLILVFQGKCSGVHPAWPVLPHKAPNKRRNNRAFSKVLERFTAGQGKRQPPLNSPGLGQHSKPCWGA